MSILIFLAVLFVLVLVHEWGHFIVAKKTGMRVDEFAIGFPPKLFGIKKGETEYTFNALPLGGFVKIWGENSDASNTDPDAGRAFNAKPKWAQALVLIAGIVMNILFAWFLFSITLLVGVPTPVDEGTATDAAELYVASTMADSPAAGVIPTGAVIEAVSANDNVLTSPAPSEFSAFINDNAASDIAVTYRFKDETSVATLRPVAGLVDGDPERFIVGTSLSYIEVKQSSITTAVFDGLVMTAQGFVAITVGLTTLIKDAFIGQADFTSIAGPVGIVGMVGDAAAFGLVSLLTFTAIISLNLAVVNLLPFPALDGGRLVFVAIEAITRKQVPAAWTGWINLVGFALLMLLMVAVTFNDISRLL